MKAITSEPGNHTANFNKSGSHYVETHSTAVFSCVSVCAASDRAANIFEARRRRRLQSHPAEVARIQEADDGTSSLRISNSSRMPTPTKEFPSSTTSMAVPLGQTVQNAWGGTNALFHQMLAKEGFAIVFRRQSREHR